MRAWKMITAVAATMAIGVSGTAYATGRIPEQLMVPGLVNDAWIRANCTGEGQGMSVLCPNPGEDPPGSLPTGLNGTMVSFGDSYSSGEGAPASAFRIACGPNVIPSDKSTAPETCGQPGTSPKWWDAVSGYYPGSDTDYNACHRSPIAYPPLVARDLGLSLDFRACSGAVSGDYLTTRDQLPGVTQEAAAEWHREPDGRTPLARQGAAPLPPDTKLVTVGFGGNNVLFSDLVTACILTGTVISPFADVFQRNRLRALQELAGDAWRNDSCAPFADRLREQLPTRLGVGQPGQLISVERVYREVRASAPPSARVLVIGYPRVFPTVPQGSCGLGWGEASMREDEQRAVNHFVVELNRHLREAATAANVEYVDIENAYTAPGVIPDRPGDHGLCRDPDDDRWIHRWRKNDPHADHDAMSGTAHPTGKGQKVAAEVMLRCYRDEMTCGNYAERKAARLVGRWKDLSYPHAGCPSREEWSENSPTRGWDEAEVSYKIGDYTGDGFGEVVVDVTCPSSTSAWPQVAVVWDIRGDDPQHLLTIKDYYWRGAVLRHDVFLDVPSIYDDIGRAPIGTPGALSVPASGGRIVMEGPAIGRNDAFCCPTHWARAVYDWNGQEFVLGHRAIIDNPTYEGEDEPPPVDVVYKAGPDGVRHGIIRGYGDASVIVDFIDRNLFPSRILGVVPVSQDAQWLVKINEELGVQPVDVPNLELLEDAGLTGVGAPPFFITIEGGKAVGLRQM